MKNYKYAVIPMTAVCVVLGAIIGIQFKTVKNQPKVVDIQRVSELTTELKSVSDEKDALYERLMESQNKVREYEEAQSDVSEAVKLLNDELEKTRMLAGMVGMKGRGVIVTMNDSSGNKNPNVDQNAYLVHAEDILSVLNELNVAGAEAVEINGQRIVSTSAVRCAGSVVNVNGVRIASPFKITAIGDPNTLESALNMSGGVVDSLAPWGIEISIKKSDNVKVSGYNGSIQYNEATVDKE
ncbi:MAG: DUF881 domain-containing protein [Tyzzerella sp.]|uniref:DUF881 domain-containing protein n=1 Tax=Candidatus Fimicola merdigallinarum TaxID=2840819 RepID=A0A9D9DZK6_9FIRM|nr:DUF881 domain-containing protein [Candidatus Fimicola merdigallinarum]